MKQHLQKLKDVKAGDSLLDVLTADFLNSVIGSLRGLARGENIVKGNNTLLARGADWVRISANAKGDSTAGSESFLPWDIYSLVGVGEPNPETGKYASYKAKVYPGTLYGMIPTNLTGEAGLTEFTISGTTTIIFKARAATNGSNITSLTIVADATQPIPQVPAVNAMPDAFDAVFAMIIGGVVFRTIGAGNISATSTKLFITDKASTPEFGQLGYESHYIWGISS